MKLFAEFLTELEAKSVEAESPAAVEPEPAPAEPVEDWAPCMANGKA